MPDDPILTGQKMCRKLVSCPLLSGEFSPMIFEVRVIPVPPTKRQGLRCLQTWDETTGALCGTSAAKDLFFSLAFSAYVLTMSALVSLDVFKPAFLVALSI
jgi:hypothetical protein